MELKCPGDLIERFRPFLAVLVDYLFKSFDFNKKQPA